MDEVSDWSGLTVSELKEALKSRGLAVSGSKSELVKRLIGAEVVEAEVAEGEGTPQGFGKLVGFFSFKQTEIIRDRISVFRDKPIQALAVVAVLMVGGSGGALLYGSDIIEWIQGEPEYKLIDFEQDQVRDYAQSLVDLGHPIWGGRMSGTL